MKTSEGECWYTSAACESRLRVARLGSWGRPATQEIETTSHSTHLLRWRLRAASNIQRKQIAHEIVYRGRLPSSTRGWYTIRICKWEISRRNEFQSEADQISRQVEEMVSRWAYHYHPPGKSSPLSLFPLPDILSLYVSGAAYSQTSLGVCGTQMPTWKCGWPIEKKRINNLKIIPNKLNIHQQGKGDWHTSSFKRPVSNCKLASEIKGFWDKTTFFAASGFVDKSRLDGDERILEEKQPFLIKSCMRLLLSKIIIILLKP